MSSAYVKARSTVLIVREGSGSRPYLGMVVDALLNTISVATVVDIVMGGLD